MLNQASICGIDEAGRGPWAGPLHIAGVLIHTKAYDQSWCKTIYDSKALNQNRREELFEHIIAHSNYHICAFTALDIDQKGLSTCLHEGITTIQSHIKASNYIIDGNTNFGVLGVSTAIKGDQKYLAIAAASILAKVSRDRFMCKLPSKYAPYQFHTHKGYGTKAHKMAIQTHGLSDLHRHSFKINLD